MSEPLSAFAVYKKQKLSKNNEKKKRKRNAKPNVSKQTATKEEIIEVDSDSEEIPQLVPIEDSWRESPFVEKEKSSKKIPIEKSKKRKLKNNENFSSENVKTKTKVSTNRKDGESLPEIYNNFDEKAQAIFEWLIAPVSSSVFFEKYWEKKPLIIRRANNNVYKHLLSTEQLDKMLRENSLFFTRNVDVVKYENGVKETFNEEGRVHPSNLWNSYSNGCSIRILNPHTYNAKVHQLLAALQEYFGTMAGANVYLTPPGSQGFAPHYDDIEAFVIQLEGRKHWKLYAPRNTSEILPRFSSDNFKPEDLNAPIKELTLEAGDMLYFPRGVIHEGFTDNEVHSLHITVSVYQRTSYADLLEHGLKAAIKIASEEDPEYRKGLPLNYLKHVGVVNSDNVSSVRDTIIKTTNHLIEKLVQYIPIDAAADQLGKQFMWDALPPVFTKEEKECSVFENGERLKNGIVYNRIDITLDMKVRLSRYYCLRLVMEEDSKIRVYYSVENAKVYHDEEPQFLEIDEVYAPAVEYLIKNYPFFIKVSELPIEDDTHKLEIVTVLWEKALIITEEPIKSDKLNEDE